MTSDDEEIERIQRFITAYSEKLEPCLEALKSFQKLRLRLHFMFTYPPQQEDEEDVFPDLPRIEDFSAELKREKLVREVEKVIRRKRLLSAPEMVEMFFLHHDKGVSYRKIAERFGVSEATARKVFRKVRNVAQNI